MLNALIHLSFVANDIIAPPVGTPFVLSNIPIVRAPFVFWAGGPKLKPHKPYREIWVSRNQGLDVCVLIVAIEWSPEVQMVILHY